MNDKRPANYTEREKKRLFTLHSWNDIVCMLSTKISVFTGISLVSALATKLKLHSKIKGFSHDCILHTQTSIHTRAPH